jgi:hypothetical protein
MRAVFSPSPAFSISMNFTGTICHDSKGQITYPLGRDVVGQLSYARMDCISPQLMRRNQPHFTSEAWRQATIEKRASAWAVYFGYFGTYEIDEIAAVVTHFIEGSGFQISSARKSCAITGSKESCWCSMRLPTAIAC